MAKHKNQRIIKNLSEGPYQTKVRQNSFTRAIQEIQQEEQIGKGKRVIKKSRINKQDKNQEDEKIKKLLKKLKGKTSY